MGRVFSLVKMQWPSSGFAFLVDILQVIDNYDNCGGLLTFFENLVSYFYSMTKRLFFQLHSPWDMHPLHSP